MAGNVKRFYPYVLFSHTVGYAAYFASNGIFIVLVAPFLMLLWPFPRLREKAVDAVIRCHLAFFTRRVLPALRVYRILEISGLERARKVGAVIFVANHRGRIDAPMMLGLVRDVAVVVKTKYARWPVLSFLSRFWTFVSVEAGNLRSISAGVGKCRALLHGGRSLLVFPEGSRARSGRLQTFRSIAFRVAVDTSTPIVPVIIHTTYPFMAKRPGSTFPREWVYYRIRFLEPLQVRAGEDADAVSERIHRRMAAELKELDKGTVWEVGIK